MEKVKLNSMNSDIVVTCVTESLRGREGGVNEFFVDRYSSSGAIKREAIVATIFRCAWYLYSACEKFRTIRAKGGKQGSSRLVRLYEGAVISRSHVRRNCLVS